MVQGVGWNEGKIISNKFGESHLSTFEEKKNESMAFLKMLKMPHKMIDRDKVIDHKKDKELKKTK